MKHFTHKNFYRGLFLKILIVLVLVVSGFSVVIHPTLADVFHFWWDDQITEIVLPKETFEREEDVVMEVEGANEKNLQIEIKNSNGEVVSVETEVTSSEDGVVVKLHPSQNIPPGKYTAEVKNKKGVVLNTSFSWGVLAINTEQAVYSPGDTAHFSFAVLDENGDMVCDASLELSIFQKATGQHDVLSTESGDITTNPECKIYGVTYNPDYEAEYLLEEVGLYDLELKATTTNGTYIISDSFEVQENIPFTVKRNTATRIYPVVTYPVELEITPHRDFKGLVREIVPKNFSIPDIGSPMPDLVTDVSDTEKELIWYVDWKAGKKQSLFYEYDSPDVSPELFSIGPLTLFDENQNEVFSEKRKWQIAVDAIAFDAKTDVTNTTSFSHTTSGSDRVLIAFVSMFATGNPDVTSITYNGSAMTKITESSNEYNTNRFIEMQAYRLIAPATGSNTVSITFAGSYLDTGVAMISYTGVDQTTPIGATGTNTSGNGDPTVSVTTTSANSIVIGGSVLRGGDSAPFTPGSGVTERWDNASGAQTSFDIGNWGGEKAAATTGSYTIDATSSSTDAMAMVGLEVNEAAGGATITVSGNVYNAGTTTAYSDCDGSTANVALRASATTYTTSCNASTGAWSIGSVTQPSAGDGLVVWIDGETTDGALVTRYDGTGDSTGNIFYANTVTFTSDDSTAVSNSHGDAYDNGNDGDIPYTVTTNALTVNSGIEVLAYTGKTYDPNGTISTNTTGGNLHVDDSATAYIDTATSTVGADVIVDTGGTLNINADTNIDGGDVTLGGTGTVNTTAGTPTTTLSGGGTLGGGTGSLNFYNLAFDSTGTSTLDAALNVTNNLTIGDGTNAHTFDAETNDDVIDVNGAFTVAANGVFSASSTASFTTQGSFTNDGTINEGTGTITLDGSTTANLDTGCSAVASCTNENLYNLTLNKSTQGTTVTLLNTGLRLSNTLTLTTGTLSQSTLDLRAEGSSAVAVATNGVLSNISTGDIILGGSVSNGGTITLQGNGASCGDADDIAITSTSGGTQRSWTGAGTFNINDVALTDQSGTSLINALSSTDNGNNAVNWSIFGGCSASAVGNELLRHGEWFSGELNQRFSF